MELDYGKMIAEATNKQKLYVITKKYLIPKDTPTVLLPTDEWLMKLAHENATNLVSFFHKKQAIDKIKMDVETEIENKSMKLKITEDLKKIKN